MKTTTTPRSGLRERKRRERSRRIAETGLCLVLARGYDATTLDAIAAAAGISRRTFFSYFRSKEDLLLAWQSGIGEDLRAAIVAERPDRAPLAVVLAAVERVAAGYDLPDQLAIERLASSTERLRASRQARYVEQENAVFAGLAELWPQAERREGLRLVAMAAIGAVRIAAERWVADDGRRPLVERVREAFAVLRSEIDRGG